MYCTHLCLFGFTEILNATELFFFKMCQHYIFIVFDIFISEERLLKIKLYNYDILKYIHVYISQCYSRIYR